MLSSTRRYSLSARTCIPALEKAFARRKRTWKSDGSRYSAARRLSMACR
jgi:hypothetical protein